MKGIMNNTSQKIQNLSMSTILTKVDKKNNLPSTALIVEDNEINKKIARLFLEGLGYQVEIASTGQAAIKLATTKAYNFILVDIGLPDIDGITVTQSIRTFEFEINRYTLIIAATASGEAYREKCLAAGMDDFITKPMLIEDIVRVLQKHNKIIEKNII